MEYAIDKVIEELSGILPEKNNKLTRDLIGNITFELADVQLVKFSPATFENRAKKLGWINGYKYGIEYPTNGKKPDLPSGTMVETIKDGSVKDFNDILQACFCAHCCSSFRIVDERYKPESASDKPWHEQGLRPPVGAIVNYKISDILNVNVEITAHGKFGLLCRSVPHGKDEKYHIWQAEKHRFMPIKRTEKEKFFDAMFFHLPNVDKQKLEKMFNDGFRAPEKK